MKAIRFLTATALTGVALTATSTLAQMAPAGVAAPAQVDCAANPTDAGCQAVNPDGSVSASGVITVTGSRIRSPNLESAAPISVVTGEQLFDTGKVAIGDTLNELPQLRNTYTQANSTRFLGTRGLSLIDLRGLGTQRTLVLVNGRRHVAADILVNGVSPDVNTFPTDLIERVDVRTGGASAIYGSDAIAGVVNFILKDNFDGVQVRGQAGISEYKDAGAQYGSVLAGQNFADGRGNIAVNFEFAHQQRYYASDRPNLRQNDAFIVVDTDAAGSPNGSDGVADRAFFQDIRSTTISLGGLLAIRYGNQNTAPCGFETVTNSSFTCNFLFNPATSAAGSSALVTQTGLRVGIGPTGSILGGNGSTSREGELVTLSPDLKRYSANLIGHFEISPAFVPFIEAKYVRTTAFGSQSGPFFSQGTTLGDTVTITGVQDRSFNNGPTTGAIPASIAVNREGIRLDNPYLSASARATITAQYIAAINSGVNPNTGTAFGTTANGLVNQAAALAQVQAGTYRFALRRNYVDLGIRDERITRETYRGVIGVRGSFWDDWSYELSANYGEYHEKNFIKGNINRQRFILANDTAVNTAGQVVCRSQIDARYAGVDRGGNPAQLAADIAACVPLNPFGVGSVSQAVRDYLTVSSSAQGKITQFVGSGFIAGDLSSLFELPGGPIGFSIGGEYRRETNFYDLDDLTQAGYAFYNAIPALTPPTAFEVKEAYGEVRVPLVKDVFLLQELTLTGSGRIADYKGTTGTVYAYGGGVEYSPVKGMRVRGTYARSVRAPNLGELYSSQSQNFAPAFADPCSARNLATGSATRSANCTAAGRPAGYDYVYSSSLEIRSGGNPGLTAEKSDSYTVGVLLEPRFMPGFSLSADYYDITVNNVITTTGSAQTIVNLCYDSATLNNPFCGLFQRASGTGPRGEETFRILEGSLLQSTANFAKSKVRGVDVNMSYRHQFDFATLSASVNYTHQLKNESYTNPSDPNFRNLFIGELADPKDEALFALSGKFNKVTVGYGLHYIDGMFLNTAEDYTPVNGQPAQNADYAPIIKYPDVYYHDIRFDLEVTDRFNIYVGVDNFTNRLPPYGLTGVGGGSGIYDNKGRYMYTGVKAKF